MKIMVFSDTHGQLDKAINILKEIKDIDLIIHCGDHKSDGDTLGEMFSTKVLSVKGNCDGSSRQDDSTIFQSPFGNILVCHGHFDNANLGYQNLYYKALERQCKAVIFGHTHKALYKEIDGFYLINPGSISEPKDGSNGTCGMIQLNQDNFKYTIIDYDSFMNNLNANKPTHNKKVQGGFLRGLLNYSDRF